MKRTITILLLFFLLCISSGAGIKSSQKLSDQGKTNLVLFCKIWGFLKYYHPFPSQKNVNWDNVLILNYNAICAAQDKKQFNGIIDSIRNTAGELKSSPKSFNPADSESVNVNFDWIKDTSLLSATNSNFLSSILANHRSFSNKYVKPVGGVLNADFLEEPYLEMTFPEGAFRYLALCRYWNEIEYFYPHKHLMDSTWESSLVQALPKFVYAQDSLEYYQAITFITARINDSHSGLVTAPWQLNYRFPPIATFLHNDTLTVVGFANDSLRNISKLREGDHILAINNKSVGAIWDSIQTHHSASNEHYAEYAFGNSSQMLSSRLDSSLFQISRLGIMLKIYTKNFSYPNLFKLWTNTRVDTKETGLYVDSVSLKRYGYLRMQNLKKSDVKVFFQSMDSTEFLIIDCRGYPEDFNSVPEVAKHIISGRKRIAQFSHPNYDYPGYLKFGPAGIKFGNRCKKSFNGKVILLVDYSTISAAEFQVMIFQGCLNSVVIGNQTAGADGNVSTVIFPGNYQGRFTGIGWFYADGRPTQRIGIVPDIQINYTYEDQIKRNDPVFNRALDFLRTGM